MSSAQSRPPARCGERRRILRRRLDARVLEQRERRHPGGDRRLERLAEVRAERHVLPRLDVARAPVVDEDDAEDVVGEGLDGNGLAEPARDADDEAELELEVEPAARAEGRRVLVGRLPLAARPDDVRAADDDAAGAAVVARPAASASSAAAAPGRAGTCDRGSSRARARSRSRRSRRPRTGGAGRPRRPGRAGRRARAPRRSPPPTRAARAP